MKQKPMRIWLLSFLLPVTLLALVLAGGVTAVKVQQVVRESTRQRTLMMLEQVARTVEDRLSGYYVRLLSMNKDQKLQEQLRILKKSPADSSAVAEINEIILRSYDQDNSIVGIVFFMENGGVYNFKSALGEDGDDVRRQEWYRRFLSSERRFYVLNKSDMQEMLSLKPYTSYMFSMLYKPMSPYVKNGLEAVFVAFQDGIFESIYRDYEYSQGGKVLIVDSNGQVVGDMNQDENLETIIAPLWQQNPPGEQSGSFEDEGYTVSYCRCQQAGWSIVHMIESDALTRDVQGVIAWVILLLTAIFAGLDVVIFVLVKQATQPLETLTAQAAGRLEGGDVLTGEDTKIAECIALSSSFNEMTHRLSKLLRHVEEAEHERSRLELTALQSQISPHFVLNTVAAIRALALETGTGEKVDKALGAFSRLLDSCLSDPSSQHTLAEEREYLESYLDIMCVRYHRQIDTCLDIPEELDGAYILKFLIQPLVENSFIHGFAAGKEGRIHIRVRARDDCLWVEVEDNGCGIKAAQIKKAMESSRNEDHGRFNRIGIGNIRRRINIHYPSQPYGMQVDSQGQGTRILLILPLAYRPQRLENPSCAQEDKEIW